MSSNKLEGRREDILAKQRLQMREEYERQKEKLISETEKARPSANRFVGQHDSVKWCSARPDLTGDMRSIR